MRNPKLAVVSGKQPFTRQIANAAAIIQAAARGYISRNAYKAAGGAAGAAGLAVGGKYAYNKYKGKSKGSSSIRSNYTGITRKATYSSNRGSRKKKTLKERVASLETNKSPKSVYTAFSRSGLYMDSGSGGVNNLSLKTLFWVPGPSRTEIESLLSTIEFPSGNVDLTSKNGINKIKIYTKLTLKNNNIHKINLKVVPLKATDNTGRTPLELYKSTLQKRALTVSSSIAAATAAASGSGVRPQYLVHPNTESQYDYISLGYNNAEGEWTNLEPVKELGLNPGEYITFYISHKFDYEPEKHDVAATEYLSGEATGFLVSCIGEIGHGAGSNGDEIGYTDWQIDGIKDMKIDFHVDNGLGLHKYVSTTDISTQLSLATNFIVGGQDMVLE